MRKQTISFDNYPKSISTIKINTLPRILKEGHQFFMEAKNYYYTEPIIKETIDIYLERLNAHLLKERQQTQLDGISVIEIDFIKRFLDMHKTIQSRDDLKRYIFDLQKAISKKEISKDSLVADHLMQIQHKLIAQHNNLILKEKIKIIINRKWLRQLRSIVKNPPELNDMNSKLGNLTNGLYPKPKESTSLFSPINEQSLVTNKNTFRLKGALGELLGDLEKFELAITVEGDQGGGKTRFTYQLADVFAEIGNKVAIFSLEIGSKSDLITRMKKEYLKSENQHKIFIADQLPEGYKTIQDATKSFDVIIIDSWNKTGLPSQDFDKLRKENPDTIFIVIFQRTTQKTIRGGTAPLFDAGINIEVVKADDSFRNNYAITSKNRYGITGIKYNIFSKEIMGTTEMDSQPVADYQI
ncbi:antirestriction protein [Aquimarina mytili]|uniref:Antirestriction protein n=1 Tax=Aquimarina mytili TaxID=874423 RepID=A0A936ZRY8_9FLAO|nr:antirestriction protein [Aquimarina mytili]MBL0683613.1 antirestriction protein [Aquimarina mytili]